MPKTILTSSDIDNIIKQGITVLALDDDMLLTDLAKEQIRQLGLKVVLKRSEKPPVASPGESERNLRASHPSADETNLRAGMIETGKIAYQSGLMISNDGNISARMADGNILITPSGVCKGRINTQDLLVINLDGEVVKPAANPALRPTSEQPMHLEVYRQRPDVCAVIHTHLIFANALVIAKGRIRMDVIPEAAVAFGSIPVTDYAMPSSPQNAEAIRELITTHNVILIRNHGSLAVGKNLEEALILTERLEHIAKTLTFAELLGGANPLPPEMLEAITKANNLPRDAK